MIIPDYVKFIILNYIIYSKVYTSYLLTSTYNDVNTTSLVGEMPAEFYDRHLYCNSG